MTTTPDIQKTIAVIEKDMSPAISRAQNIKITTQEEQNEAGEALSVLNKYADTIEERKKEITQPMNTALKSVRELFKPVENKLSVAISELREAMGTFQFESERAAKEQEAKIAARVGEGKGKIKVDTAMRKMGEVEHADEVVATASGTTKFRTAYRLKFTDEEKLILEIFKQKLSGLVDLNETALLSYLKVGKKLAGVELEEYKQPVNSR